MQSFSKPFKSLRSCHIPSIAATPAAFASTGIFPLEYFAPSESLVYSTPMSLRRSKIPNTTAGILLLEDAISYVFTTPSADYIEGII